MDRLNQLYPLFETLPSGEEKPTSPESFYEDTDPEIRSRATVGKTTAKRAITNLCKDITTDTTRIKTALQQKPKPVISDIWMHTSQKELLASKEKLDRALMTLSQNLLRHAIIHGVDVESNFQSYEAEASEYEKKAAETKESISAALSLLVISPASVQPAQLAPEAPYHPAQHKFLVSHLRPTQNLDISMKISEVEQWKIKFRSYFKEANLSQASIDAQAQHAAASIAEDLWRRICFLSNEQKVSDPLSDFSIDPASDSSNSLFSHIDNIFAEIHPLLNRRLQCLNTLQKQGESIDPFMARLMIAIDYAHFDKMSQEDVIVLIIYNSIKDPGLKKELFKIPAKERKRTRIRQEISKYNHLQAQLAQDEPANHTVNFVAGQNKQSSSLCLACGKPTPGDRRQFCSSCFTRGPDGLRCTIPGCRFPNKNHSTSGHKAATLNRNGANWSAWRRTKTGASTSQSPQNRRLPNRRSSPSPRRLKSNASPTPYSRKFGQRQRRPSVNSVSESDDLFDASPHLPDPEDETTPSSEVSYAESDFCGYISSVVPQCNIVPGSSTGVSNNASEIDSILDNMTVLARAYQSSGPFRSILTCPDSGCGRDIVGLALARALYLAIEKTNITVCGANSLPLSNDGITKVDIKYHNANIVIEALVSSSVDDRLLLSRTSLIKLHVLPSNFPEPLEQ